LDAAFTDEGDSCKHDRAGRGEPIVRPLKPKTDV
jgi:hypothetical protein